MARLHLDILKTAGCILLLFLLVPRSAQAQISPGPLSKGHETLEGVDNCTSCHERGSEIAPSKCLSCHTEIGSAIAGKHGMHSLAASRTCNECHKEHLGRDVQITRFSPGGFNHKETGFDLTGKHDGLQCARCHEQARFKVEKTALPKNSSRKTYLGLRADCASCHEDRHEKTAGFNCQSCHTTAAWTPIGKFEHAKTPFALTGRHETVTCAKCHGALAVTPHPATIPFSVSSFNDCTPCHRSPHKLEFSRNRLCSDCHTTQGWNSTKAFNHSMTRFPLAGKHASVACEQCHAGMKNHKEGTPVDFATKPFNDCRSCHKSPHNQTLNRSACSSCHTPVDWHTVANSEFDHSQTEFPLRGTHVGVACQKCHERGRTATSAVRYHDSQRCSTCHEDYHKGTFGKRYKDCADCHAENGFVPSIFTIADHGKLRFALTGSHGAVLCKECHIKKNGSTLFVFQSLQCVTCHADFHKEAFQKFMGTDGCASCHTPQTWNQVLFDHSKTGFSLDGKHSLLSCPQCHKPQNGSTRYRGTPKQCASCHQEPHHKQFAQTGATPCENCHTPRNWRILIFNHEAQSTFHLNGAHARVPCGACHREEETTQGNFVRFKPLPQTCESCHQGKR